MATLEDKIQQQLGALLFANLKQSQIVEDLHTQLKQAVDGHAEVVEGLKARVEELTKLLADYEGPVDLEFPSVEKKAEVIAAPDETRIPKEA
jgi:hypothetical protein